MTTLDIEAIRKRHANTVEEFGELHLEPAEQDRADLLSALEAANRRAEEAEESIHNNGGSGILLSRLATAQLELTTLRARVAELEGDAEIGSAFRSVWDQAQQNHVTYSATGTREDDIRFLTLGLTGEAGELANFVKKRWRDGDGHDEDIKKESADVFAYDIMLAAQFGLTPLSLLMIVAEKQQVFINKMKARDAALKKEPTDG